VVSARRRRVVLEVQPRRLEQLAEPLDVDGDVLPVHVHLLHLPPPAAADHPGFTHHGAVEPVLRRQGALLGRHLVLEVLQPELLRGLAVERVCGPVQTHGHDLEEHGPGTHEQEVGHRGAVHGHHGVRGGQRGVDGRERRLTPQVHHVRREPGAAARRDDVGKVEENTVLLADEDDQLRLGAPRVVVQARARPGRRRQRERHRRPAVALVEERLEVLDALACILALPVRLIAQSTFCHVAASRS
jgi:hypothetical protein